MWSLAEERGMLRHKRAFEKFADINEVLCLAPKWCGVLNSLSLLFRFNHFALAFIALVLESIDCSLLALDSSSFCFRSTLSCSFCCRCHVLAVLC